MRLGVNMAQQPIIEIAEFPHDNKLWRIDNLGAITSKLGNNNNLMIEVNLRPVSQSTLNQFASSFYKNNKRIIDENWQQRITCQLNIGQLPILTIGSIWKNGQLETYNAISQTVSVQNVNITKQNIQFIDSNKKIKYFDRYNQEKDGRLIPFSYFGLDYSKPISCLQIQHDDYIDGMIIPVTEIIRFYYAFSTRLAHLAFSSPHEISKIHYSVDEENHKVTLKLPQKYTDNEAFILARILSNETAFAGFEKIKNSLMKLGINSKATSLLESHFPFTSLTNLTVRGIKIHERFFVTEICSCSAPFPNVIVDRDNDGRKANKETDISDEDKQTYQREQPTAGQKDNLAIQSEEESPAYIKPLQFTLNKDCFLDLANKEIEKPEKPFNQYKSSYRIVNIETSATGLGTDLGTTGQTTIAPSAINMLPEKQHREVLAATFENSVLAIKYLNEHYADIQTAIHLFNNENCDFVPFIAPRNKAQWSYLDSKSKTRRKVLFGKIEYCGKTFWLIEIQARDNEHFVTAILHLDTNNEIDYFANLLHELAKNKGIWGKLVGIQNMKTFKHTHTDIKSYAEKIYTKIINFNK